MVLDSRCMINFNVCLGSFLIYFINTDFFKFHFNVVEKDNDNNESRSANLDADADADAQSNDNPTHQDLVIDESEKVGSSGDILQEKFEEFFAELTADRILQNGNESTDDDDGEEEEEEKEGEDDDNNNHMTLSDIEEILISEFENEHNSSSSDNGISEGDSVDVFVDNNANNNSSTTLIPDFEKSSTPQFLLKKVSRLLKSLPRDKKSEGDDFQKQFHNFFINWKRQHKSEDIRIITKTPDSNAKNINKILSSFSDFEDKDLIIKLSKEIDTFLPSDLITQELINFKIRLLSNNSPSSPFDFFYNDKLKNIITKETFNFKKNIILDIIITKWEHVSVLEKAKYSNLIIKRQNEEATKLVTLKNSTDSLRKRALSISGYNNLGQENINNNIPRSISTHHPLYHGISDNKTKDLLDQTEGERINNITSINGDSSTNTNTDTILTPPSSPLANSIICSSPIKCTKE
ncbi:hypothetical protein PACTADRAFT_49341 [Pachysolen tannophilus NRRL Y-2460]|uniref:Uncharacterized protein n=1 Tax=Pachysolen tannophilus NRRL Y-2460 TaxID=669874 RepID=A0A1E4TVZ5_PACTA|nr:hypothetical protein PACTADRAFT_49341 [Pachysolen tannophilus NRRL Y-2460]